MVHLFRSSRIIFYRDALAEKSGSLNHCAALAGLCWIHADNLIDTGRMQSAGICSRLIGTHSLIQLVIASDFCAMAWPCENGLLEKRGGAASLLLPVIGEMLDEITGSFAL